MNENWPYEPVARSKDGITWTSHADVSTETGIVVQFRDGEFTTWKAGEAPPMPPESPSARRAFLQRRIDDLLEDVNSYLVELNAIPEEKP